jgi:hypothetical protein
MMIGNKGELMPNEVTETGEEHLEEGEYKAPRFRSAAEQILSSPYFRRRLFVHKPVVNEDGTIDTESGEMVNPPASKRYRPRSD